MFTTDIREQTNLRFCLEVVILLCVFELAKPADKLFAAEWPSPFE